MSKRLGLAPAYPPENKIHKPPELPSQKHVQNRPEEEDLDQQVAAGGNLGSDYGKIGMLSFASSRSPKVRFVHRGDREMSTIVYFTEKLGHVFGPCRFLQIARIAITILAQR